ncbi:hypothetical protein MASR2M15_10470 [Anaerolineales bacterium]
MKIWHPFFILILLFSVSLAYAQDTTLTPESSPVPPTPVATLAPPPASFRLQGLHYESQNWNNCGPATLTNALSFFGYADNQKRAAEWLKPNYEDKNVSPWQMAEFVNRHVPEMAVYAKVRYGGDLLLLKQLISNNFPVIIEAGYDPEPDRLGWMGHYLLIDGYDDQNNQFHTLDSYIGPNTTYTYDYIDRFWQHFDRVYMVLYESSREEELNRILGDDADEWQNSLNALDQSRSEAMENPENSFAWFNMGSNFLRLGMYPKPAIAYDQARNYGLPWRMLWYQFGPYEAYYHVGRYDDIIALVTPILNDGGGHFVEESYYYGGLAREGKGEYDRALANYTSAIEFNPNFTPALEARDRVVGLINGTSTSNNN